MRRLGILVVVVFLGALTVSACGGGGSGTSSAGSANSASGAAGSSGSASSTSAWPASLTKWLKSLCSDKYDETVGGPNCNCMVSQVEKHFSTSLMETQEQRSKQSLSYTDHLDPYYDQCLPTYSGSSGLGNSGTRGTAATSETLGTAAIPATRGSSETQGTLATADNSIRPQTLGQGAGVASRRPLVGAWTCPEHLEGRTGCGSSATRKLRFDPEPMTRPELCEQSRA